MQNLLNLFTDVAGFFKDEPLVAWISVGTIVVLIGILFLICLKSKNDGFDTKKMAYAGICIATSFALSFVKFKFIPSGSITVASLVPIMLYAYFFGTISGLLVGIIHGLLQFIESAWLYNATTFLLDYPIAFASIAMMGLARKFIKKELPALTVGVLLTYLCRFLAHLISGFIYFGGGIIETSIPHSNMFLYSFIYQISYVGPDMIIALVVTITLSATKTIQTLEKLINKNRATN
ncbi:MAG: energy-coupled thiamine transporter ThiT [Clostridia bacterium]|nr:energy-coupled thiamine transporter ThiT [Clostridia bacterium]